MANILIETGQQITADGTWSTIYTYSQTTSGLILGMRVTNNSEEGITYHLEVGGDEIGSFLPLPEGAADEHIVSNPIVVSDTQTIRLKANSSGGTANVTIKLTVVERS